MVSAGPARQRDRRLLIRECARQINLTEQLIRYIIVCIEPRQQVEPVLERGACVFRLELD